MAIIAPIVSTFDNKGIQRASSAFGDFGRTVGRQLKNVATAAVGIGVALGAASVKAISAASDLDEAISATRQIFGDASEAVLKFADDAAEAFGISKQSALEGAQTFGTFGKAAGLAGDDLSDFTNDFLGLASDVASFRNASPEEVIEAIGAGLRGESEPLRRFGVLLDDATLKAEALALGIYDGNGSLDQQQKILAAESAIWKQTSDAQGDFARTSGGLANQQRILRARLSNVTAQIGTQLLPIALKLSGFFLDTVIPSVESLADTFAEEGLLGVLRRVWEWLKETGPKIGRWALELAGSLISWISENAGPALSKLGSWLQAIGRWIRDTAWPWLKEKTAIWSRALWEWITDTAIPKLWDWLQAVGSWIRGTAWPWLTEKTSVWANVLWTWITEEALPKLWEWLRAIGSWIRGTAWPWLKEKTSAWGSALWTWIDTKGRTTISAISTWLTSIADWVSTKGAKFLEEKMYALVDSLWKWIGSKETETATDEAATDVADNFAKFLVKELGPALLRVNVSVAKAIRDGLKGAVTAAGENLAKDFLSGFTGGSGGASSVVGGLLDRLTISGGIKNLLGDIGVPGLATGGIVTKPTLAMIGEGGEPEAVIPLSKMGNMGTTVNITINGAVDPVSTARQIRTILDQDARRLGRLSVV